jgi:hypothetical protein
MIHAAVAALALVATLGAAVAQADVTITPVDPLVIDISDRCIRTTAQMVPPKITMFGGAPPSTSAQSAPSSKFAILGLEITDFDPAIPPEIRVFDDTEGPAAEPKEKIAFTAVTAAPCPPVSNLTVPVFQAYDETPFQRPGNEPRATLTRVEVHHPKLTQPIITFFRMEKGVFVVPVYWHDIAEAAVGKAYVDPKQVMELFWTIPRDPVYGAADDVNSIWSQANVQFRLTNNGIPFRLSNIPTHIVPAPQKSRVVGCSKGWTADYNSKAAVDIYGIYTLSGGGGDADGIGNCRAEGYVLIRANDPATQEPGFSSPLGNKAGRANLVAHEFGHFLASLPHKNDSLNLMHSMLGSAILEPAQIDLVRQRIKNFGTFNADR